MTPTRRLAVGALAVAAALAGCSSSSGVHPSAAAITTVATLATNPSSGPTTTVTVAAYPIVGATGSLLQPPATPVTIAAEQDCRRLLTQPASTAGIRACVTATAPSGAVTGTDESYAHSEQWDVWRRRGSSAELALTFNGNFQSTPGFVFHSADPANDADTKLLAVEHAPATQAVSAIDIIETSGAVVAHITLGTKGGVVGPAPGGGIATWSTAGTGSATATVIRYTEGAWRTVSTSSVPTSQIPTYPNDDGFGGGLP